MNMDDLQELDALIPGISLMLELLELLEKQKREHEELKKLLSDE